jgi:hypothetical protein
VELGVGLPHQQLPGVRREADVVVAEVEPSLLSIRVVGGHGAQRVQLSARIPQHERKAAGVNRLSCPLLACGKSVKLATEEMDPEVPVRRDPRNPS